MKKEAYESPSVKVVEVVVEKGFAASGSGTSEPGLNISSSDFGQGSSDFLK